MKDKYISFKLSFRSKSNKIIQINLNFESDLKIWRTSLIIKQANSSISNFDSGVFFR